MTYTNYVVIDFETDNTNNKGLEYWSKDFKIVSCSVLMKTAINSESYFLTSMDEISGMLHYCYDNNFTFLVYNAVFDAGIIKHVFKIDGIFSRVIDVWRLFNYCDQRVDDKLTGKKLRNTSLSGAVHYLFGIEDYKEKYLNTIISMKLAKNKKEAHKNIAQLPPELLEEYNNLDTYWTWEVYVKCLEMLSIWNIDWKIDYSGYIKETELYSDSFYKGIRVDKNLLLDSISTLKTNIENLDTEIRKFKEIEQAEELLTPHYTKVTPKMRKLYLQQSTELLTNPTDNEILTWYRQATRHKLNWRSSKDKITLFINVLKLPVVKLTKGGKKGNPAPEISKKTLSNYGEIGNKLLKLLKMIKELDECEKIYSLSEEDGRLHPHLRSGTTVSGRSSSSFN